MNRYNAIKKNITNILSQISQIHNHNAKILIATKTHFHKQTLQSAIIDEKIIIGENRLQEALEKKEILNSFPNKKHFIGKLQKNKVRKTIQFFDCIETVDSLSLMERINKISKEENKIMEIFLNINISNDEKKTGFTKMKAKEIINNYNFSSLQNIKITGLFTILQYGITNDEKREYYREMKNIFDEMQKVFLMKNINYFTELSMGMSNDYQIAIEEGATIVRIGTAIFGKR